MDQKPRDRVHATKTQRVRVAFLETRVSLEPYLFLSRSRPSGPPYSPIVGSPQKSGISTPNPDSRQASKTHFSTALSPYYARFGPPPIGFHGATSNKPPAGSPPQVHPRIHLPRVITFAHLPIVISATRPNSHRWLATKTRQPALTP